MIQAVIAGRRSLPLLPPWRDKSRSNKTLSQAPSVTDADAGIVLQFSTLIIIDPDGRQASASWPRVRCPPTVSEPIERRSI